MRRLLLTGTTLLCLANVGCADTKPTGWGDSKITDQQTGEDPNGESVDQGASGEDLGTTPGSSGPVDPSQEALPSTDGPKGGSEGTSTGGGLEPAPDPDAGSSSEGTASQSDSTDSASQEPTLSEPVDLPAVTGECPDMRDGGSMLFRRTGMNKHRLVQIWADPDAKGKKGPLVFYWHGTGMNPGEALVGLGPLIQKVTAMGGVVAAPFRDPEAGVFPWFLVDDLLGHRLDDLLLADEVLACAREQIGIDTRQIHTLGLSAGGLQSTQMSYRRSNYIASSVIYSGGLIIDPPPSAEPRNKFSSMIFHGGPADIVVLPFAMTSERYLKELLKAEQFGFMCEHLSGHIIPPGVSDSVWQFFMDHPFATESPYKKSGLPNGFPRYCKMPGQE